LLGLYDVWHCHDKAVILLPVGMDVFCEVHHNASTELHSTMQNSRFHHDSENALRVLPENPQNTVSITFPADGATLTFWLKVNLDVSIALKRALIRVGSDAPIRTQ
jgi:hypothetical protein